MNHKLYILVGVPGAGKSTYLKDKLSSGSVTSRDAIRFSLVKENEEYFSREKEVFNIFVSEIKKSLAENENTYADATHISIASRTKLLRALGSSLKDVEVIPIVIQVSLQTALDHNELRKGTRAYVPRSVIRRMYEQFEKPSFEEGFRKIIIWKSKESKYIYEEDIWGIEKVK